jgi:hypothetical protein
MSIDICDSLILIRALASLYIYLSIYIHTHTHESVVLDRLKVILTVVLMHRYLSILAVKIEIE